MNRDFKGIWIPREIWLSEKLSIQEKVFLAEIHSLDNEIGCIASNAYFAEFFGMSKSSVSRIISTLVEKGFCEVTLTYKNEKEVDKRIVRCARYGYKEVKLIKEEKPAKPRTSDAQNLLVSAVIDYLNKVAVKKFRKGVSFTRLIAARSKEGYVLADFKHVIDVKSKQWIDTDFDKFLRPSTLFSLSKFPEYLSEKFIRDNKDIVEGVSKAQKGFYDV